MRVTNWEDPVHARLQRRFVRFLSSNVEDRAEEVLSTAFNALMDRVRIELVPAYPLAPAAAPPVYAPWHISLFLTKILRNTASYVEKYSLSPRVSKRIQEELAPGLGRVALPVERIFEKKYSSLDDRDRALVEQLLNLGHATVGGVLTLWQVRANIVGERDEEGEKYVKEFIKPLLLGGDAASLEESLPVTLRAEVLDGVEELSEQFESDAELRGFATLAAAVRLSVGEEFRALVTYSTEADRLPVSRDDCFVATLHLLLAAAMTSEVFSARALYENLVAAAALEEALGTREPRRSVRLAFQRAVRDVCTAEGEQPGDLQTRVRVVENALGMMLRLPAGEGRAVRVEAYREAVDEALGSGAPMSAALRDRCMRAATALDVDQAFASKYVTGILRSKFDRFVGQMLMTADTALAMPELSAIFVGQVADVAAQCDLASPDAAQRTGLLAGAVFESVLEAALEEEGKKNIDRVDSLIRKAHNIAMHPVVLDVRRGGKSVLEIGVRMLASKVPPSRLLQLIRGLEALRQRALGRAIDDSAPAWREAGAADPEYAAFLLELQSSLLKEHSAGTIYARTLATKLTSFVSLFDVCM
jgi:hypothetical protein